MKVICKIFATVAFSSFAGRYCIITGIDENGYRQDCRYGEAQKVTGDAFSTFADAFNMNPASLPTRVTPLSLEGIISKKSAEVAGPDSNGSFIKGLTGLGIGAATNSDNTFYSTSLVQKALKSTQGKYLVQKDSLLPTLNAGIATDWLRYIFKSSVFPTLGYAYRYNQTKGTQGFGWGSSFNYQRISLGFSYVHEPEIPLVPEENFKSYSVGIDLNALVFDLSFTESSVRYSAGAYQAKFFTTVGSASLFVGPWVAAASYKKYQDFSQAINELWMFSVQRSVFKRFRILYLYNYVPGAQSLGLQALL